ncbi:MAG: 16S rRNA (guanine(966)-N(2))-methyltransferase RsmD [Eubacterium sp.]|nr:16S rRNA (guanine(966)-N(2))-methyltransferase RsmD [Eubacterium sp.]
MRVITGSARGRRLETLAGEDVTRPTSQAVKEALFSSIQFELEGKRVLDLFAGCGQLGIEALSRGAAVCTFVENNRAAYKITEGNIAHCGFGECSNLVFADAQSFLQRSGSYDIAFLDPPYSEGLYQKCLDLLSAHMSDDGVIICESKAVEPMPDSAGDFKKSRERKYGKSKLTYYRKD